MTFYIFLDAHFRYKSNSRIVLLNHMHSTKYAEVVHAFCAANLENSFIYIYTYYKRDFC